MGRDERHPGYGQYVLFRSSGEMYGMDVAAIREIIRPGAITAVPQTPEHIEGVTRIRGEVIPVVDMARRLGLEPEDRGIHARVLVLELERCTAGLLVDSAQEVIDIPEEDVDPQPPIMASDNTAYLRGVARVDDRLVMLVDAEQLMMSDDLSGIVALAAA